MLLRMSSSMYLISLRSCSLCLCTSICFCPSSFPAYIYTCHTVLGVRVRTYRLGMRHASWWPMRALLRTASSEAAFPSIQYSDPYRTRRLLLCTC